MRIMLICSLLFLGGCGTIALANEPGDPQKMISAGPLHIACAGFAFNVDNVPANVLIWQDTREYRKQWTSEGRWPQPTPNGWKEPTDAIPCALIGNGIMVPIIIHTVAISNPQ